VLAVPVGFRRRGGPEGGGWCGRSADHERARSAPSHRPALGEQLVVGGRGDRAAHAEGGRQLARRRQPVPRAKGAPRGDGTQRVGELHRERALAVPVQQQWRQLHEWPSELGRDWPSHDATVRARMTP
jgi:hypothetical protein